MAKRKPARNEFEERRRKEQVAFLVVKFLKSFVAFETIRTQFENSSCQGGLSECGLFEKVRDLEESLAYDLKENAHSLFRGREGKGRAEEPRRDSRGARRLDGLKRSIEARAIDSYIGTGFHYLLMLRESLYQIERYTPEYEKEREEIARIEEITRKAGRALTDEEQRELERLHALGEISLKLGTESEDLARRVVRRCEDLFKSTAEVVRHLVEGAGDNEILIQNLLRNIDLLEAVYGKGSAERIFSDLFRGREIAGDTGMEKALLFAREKCGNVTGLPLPPGAAG
jgi:hypothetical protein